MLVSPLYFVLRKERSAASQSREGERGRGASPLHLPQSLFGLCDAQAVFRSLYVIELFPHLDDFPNRGFSFAVV